MQTGIWVALITLIGGIGGALITLRGNWRNSDVDIMKELRQANNDLKATNKELIEVRKENLQLHAKLDNMQETIDDLTKEVKRLTGLVKGAQQNGEV